MRGKQLCHHLGHKIRRLYSVGGISGEKKAERSEFHTPLRESQHGPLSFWSKAMPSAAENYMLFEKQFLM